MGSNAVQVITLANSIIGVSVLAMPYCFKQCGIVLSVLLLCLSSILSRLACHFLLKAAIITRRRNYEFLAFHVFGSSGKLGVELAIIGFLLGTCVAFFVVMGDLGPAIISSMFSVHRTDTLRTSILISMAFFVVLPLGLLRNVDSLSSLCTASIAFYLCLVLKVMGEAIGPMVSGDWLNQVNFWRPEGVLQCLPIFSMALFCQTQLFEIFDTVPNAALDKLNAVIRVAINMCTAMYILVGFFGYVAFSKENITGNILVSLSQTMSSEIIKLGFVLSVAVSFPLVIFPCRASLYSLLYRNAQPPVHDTTASHVPEGRFKLLTFGIVGVSLVIGLLLPNIERVLGIIGSTIGVTICIILPSLLLGNTARHSKDRLASQIILWSGAIIMILGTYAHILNGEAAGAADPGLEQVANRILDQAVNRLNEQPHEAIGFQLAPSDKVVKKLIEMSDEKARGQLSGSLSEKSKSNAQSKSGSNNDKSSLSKDIQAKQALIKEEKSSSKVSNAEVADKPIEVHEKIQEPAVPADTGEKQQEPAVPVEAVVKHASASAEPVVPVIPAPSSESIPKEPKLPKRKMKMKELVLTYKNKTAMNLNAEQVNQDAIRHEEAESALEARDSKEKNNGIDKGEQKQSELEAQKKKDEEQKLIETLKEHQEVQRDMLNEQQRILQELKKHEKVHEKSANEVDKDSPAKSAPSQNLDTKIKDTGPNPAAEQNRRSLQLPEKQLTRDFPNLRKSNISALVNNYLQPPSIPLEGKPAMPVPYPKESKFVKAVPVMPLPLAYSAKVSSSPPAKIIPEHVDSKAVGRDILESGVRHSDREKRDLIFVSNIETDQGAGDGPVVLEERKPSGDPQVILLENSNKECKRNVEDAALQNLRFKDPIVSVPSVSVAGSDNAMVPDVVRVSAPPKNAIGRNDGLVLKDSTSTVQNAGKAKEPNTPVMELKTPSSISEPEIHADLHRDGQKLSNKNLPIPDINYLKPIQSKDSDLLQ